MAYFDVHLYAELEGKVASILGCSNNRQRAMPVQIAPLQDAFGVQTGELAYEGMKEEFNKALPYNNDTAYIECVATLERARGKGVSTALMRHVMTHLPYRCYMLEVTDTNDAALRLYEKLGFREVERKVEPDGGAKGFHARIYMEWNKTES